MGISRRDLLRGNLGRTPPPAKPIVKPGQSLPSVISWLDPEMRPTERRAASEGFPLLRPPGAIAEPDFLATCTRCNDCAEACPHDAIHPAPERLRDAAGTPWIDPLTEPCRLCDDLPCIAACEPRALRPEAPAALGTARIQVLDCLNQLGTTCSVCLERCPVPGAIESVGAVPSVSEALCTGCGICQSVCPAPSNAVLILPNPERPTPAALDAAALPEEEPPLELEEEPPLELPDLHEAELDEAGLRTLFHDIGTLAEVDEIRLKHGPTERTRDRAPSPEAALELLLAGDVRAVQIRYRHRGEAWCDTILATPTGHRVVRMAEAALV